MLQGPHERVVVLGGAFLDLGRGTLVRDGRIVPLRSKSFRLLCELARHSGRVVSKDELLEAVWPGVSVTEDSLTQAVRDIRRSLGAEGRRLLRTVARRGFILCPDEGRREDGPVVRSTRPRIAVLPLRDRTGEPGLGPVIDALAEEVTNGLARFRNLTVVARHSAFAASREGLSLAEVGARLSVDFVVDGSARLAGGQLRMALALNEAASGTVLWGDSFDAGDTGWLGLHDLVPRRVVSRLFNSIEEAGYRSSLRRGPRDLTAFEHLARGKALFRSFEPGANEKALEQFAAAIEADPAFGLAHSYHAMADLAVNDFAAAPLEVKLRAKAEAARGVALSSDESGCHSILAYCHATLGEFEAAEREARHAIGINPCDADALFKLAVVLVWRGASAEALEWIERAKGIEPLWPAYYDLLHSEALLFLGRYAESARMLRGLPALNPRQEMQLAATYALGGEPDLARHHAAQARAAALGRDVGEWTRTGHPRGSADDIERLAEGIRLALGLLDGR
jgi:TolB-like protein/DNA-binding winged helix-turn-helix (wHTH) protein